jgi:DMSO/TMAO reductase YedYZ molybdopterin-dependent catalytic subunit
MTGVPNMLAQGVRSGSHRRLPIGQRERVDFPRYGLLRFADRWPQYSSEGAIEIFGDVTNVLAFALQELSALPYREQQSDLHCVATWSRLGLSWGGYRFRDVYEQVIVPRTIPKPGVRHLWVQGADGFSASLPLEDALADDVLLATALDRRPLPLEHGAPLRLVAPAHYGYKSVRHLKRIGLYRRFRAGYGGPLVHPRARVSLEERSRHLPGAFYRRLYRAVLPWTLRLHRHLGNRGRPADPR